MEKKSNDLIWTIGLILVGFIVPGITVLILSTGMNYLFEAVAWVVLTLGMPLSLLTAPLTDNLPDITIRKLLGVCALIIAWIVAVIMGFGLVCLYELYGGLVTYFVYFIPYITVVVQLKKPIRFLKSKRGK